MLYFNNYYHFFINPKFQIEMKWNVYVVINNHKINILLKLPQSS
jgi:hypothetical protein